MNARVCAMPCLHTCTNHESVYAVVAAPDMRAHAHGLLLSCLVGAGEQAGRRGRLAQSRVFQLLALQDSVFGVHSVFDGLVADQQHLDHERRAVAGHWLVRSVLVWR